MQNTLALEGDVDRIDEFHDFGVRMMQPTYNSQTLVGDGCTERTDAGLSHFGVDVVERLNDLDMVVDLSHCGHATSMDAIDVSEAPPAFTHAMCRGLYEHPRGKTDEELEAFAERDGFFGVVALPTFLGLSEDLEAMVDHIEHAAEIVGVDCVGITTDWGTWTKEVPGPLQDGLREMFFEHIGFGEGELGVDGAIEPLTSSEEWLEIPRASGARLQQGRGPEDLWRELPRLLAVRH